MISVNDFYPGLTIELDGEIYIVLEYQHVHMAQGQATVKVKLKNLKTGNVLRKHLNQMNMFLKLLLIKEKQNFFTNKEMSIILLIMKPMNNICSLRSN